MNKIITIIILSIILVISGCDSFTYDQFTYSKIAKQYNIDNHASKKHVLNGQRLYEKVVKPIKKQFPDLEITSWYRSPQLNRIIGGHKNSQHVTGNSIDLKFRRAGLNEVAIWIVDNLEFDQLIIEPGWIHISYSDNNRKEVLTYNGKVYMYGIK